MIYLDPTLHHPRSREVAHAVYDTLQLSGWGNAPSSQYPIGKQARDAVAAARETIAAALGCKSEQFVFTSCGSESDNWAVRLALHQNRHVGKHVITTAVEHSAMLETWQRPGRAGGLLRHALKARQERRHHRLSGRKRTARRHRARHDDARQQRDGLHLPRGRGRAASESEKVPCPAAHRRGAGPSRKFRSAPTRWARTSSPSARTSSARPRVSAAWYSGASASARPNR